MATMSKWTPDQNPHQARRVGKTLEEMGEAVAVFGNAVAILARISIQGLDSVDPGTGKTNRQRLQDELADVQAQIGCTVLSLGLDQNHMARRRAEKMRQMGEWESHFSMPSA